MRDGSTRCIHSRAAGGAAAIVRDGGDGALVALVRRSSEAPDVLPAAFAALAGLVCDGTPAAAARVAWKSALGSMAPLLTSRVSAPQAVERSGAVDLAFNALTRHGANEAVFRAAAMVGRGAQSRRTFWLVFATV